MSLVLTQRQVDEAALLYVEHEWPLSDLSEHFGVSKNAIAHALQQDGVTLRTRADPPKPLRMKQCAHCLHFLPVGLFSARDARHEKIASWCDNCTNQPRPPRWNTNPAPLAQVINQWRTT